MKRLWRTLFARKRAEAELDDELRAHLAIDLQQRIDRGELPESARYAALRDLGNLGQVKEVTREMWGFGALDRVWQDSRYAVRSLRRSPGFTLIAVAALALGIGATTAIFTVAYSVLFRPLSYPQPGHLVAIWERPPHSDRRNVVAMPNFMAWKERSRSFEAIAAFRQVPMNLLGGDEPVQVSGIAASADFFLHVLRVAPALGRTFLPDEDGSVASRVAVLTHGLWQRRFGGRADILGQRISINAAHHEIIGVMPPDFAYPNRRIELFVPLRLGRDDGRNYSVIARLRPDVGGQAAQDEITAIAAQTARERPALNAGWGATVVPLHQQTVGQVRQALLVLVAAAGFVLLVACTNVANLLLMRSAGRASEISIRLALGAGRRRLAHQLLVEGLILASAGGIAGVLLARWGLDAILAVLPANFPLPRMHEIRIDPTVLLFTACISALVGVLFSLAPAVSSRGLDITRALHQSSRSVASGHRLRGVLVIAEVALTLLLAAGAGLMIRSYHSLSRVDPGFVSQNLLTVRMLLLPSRDPANHAQLVSDVLERVRALPGVIAAGSIGNLPMAGGNSGTWYYRADQPAPRPGEQPGGDVSIITPGYFRTMGIPLLKGRDFEERDRIGAPKVAIVNQTAARLFFAGEDPIGKRLSVSWNDAREVEIIGVTGDIRHSQLLTKPDPCLFLPNAQQPFPFVSLVVRTSSDPYSIAGAVKDSIRQVDGDQGVAEIRTMGELIDDSIARQRLQMLLLGMLGVLALTLAAVGIYGVISYSAAQRRREFGIRMALGAERASILATVVKDGLRLTLAGLVIGLLGALALTRQLRNLLFEVEPNDPIVMTAVCALLAIVAVAACCVPAFRATRVDPAVVLRQE